MIKDLSTHSWRFFAHASATATTADHRPGRGVILPVADAAFASVIAVPSAGGTGSAKNPAANTAVAHHAPSPTSAAQGVASAAIAHPSASTLSPPGDPVPSTTLPPSGHISTRTRRRTATATSTGLPATGYGFVSGGVPRPPAQRANTPPRVPRSRQPLPVVTAPAPAGWLAPTVPIPPGPDRELLFK